MSLKVDDSLRKTIESINVKYSIYKNVSPDELRNALRKIEECVSSSANHSEILDKYLEDVFAIVKATAYMFSKGNIEVEANSYDRSLAEQYDFVQIVGDKAIYSNQWKAAGETVTWKMVHYDEQLLGGIYLHKGYAVEMATGEGKTLVATLPVMLNALTHKGVHVMTVNNYLSKRDCEITRPLYAFHGLSVGCIEYFRTHSPKRKAEYNSDITFGTNSAFVFDHLRDHMTMSPDECIQRGHNYAIIDELDSILIDDADTPHIVGGGQHYDVGQDYKEYKPIFEEIYNSENGSELFIVNKKDKCAYYTEKGEQLIAEKVAIPDLYSYKKWYQISDYKKLSKEEQHETNKKFNIQNVFHQLLRAYSLYEKDVDYIVDEVNKYGNVQTGVIIIDKNTGRKKESYRLSYGLHTAIEVKENVPTQEDFDSMAVISLKNYFRLYNKCSGMSGTIMPVSDELSNVYGLQSVSVPTHCSVARKDLPLKVYKTKEEKDKAIVEEIKKLNKQHRPVLVGSVSIVRSQELSQLLKEEGIKHLTLDAKNEEQEASIICKAGIEDSITLSTSMAGRGTDIKLTSKSKELGGLAIIGTDLFESTRIDRQLKGRAGRQGDPGSSLFFVSLDDFIVSNLSDEDKRGLQHEASLIEGDDISTPEIVNYIYKAQKNVELELLKQRTESARKDDIIAPHRKKFYDERNNVLKNNSVANSIVANIVKDSSCSMELDVNLRQLYKHAHALVSVSKFNNKVREKFLIPFSDSLHLYSVSFDIDKLIDSFDYFCAEYKRQIILQVYDKYWKRFVVYMMGNLDQHEVDLLESEYFERKQDINDIIISRMLHATIPVGWVGEDAYSTSTSLVPESTHPKGNTSNRTTYIKIDDLCPCGSGKKFGECHGMNTHQNSIKKRRR